MTDQMPGDLNELVNQIIDFSISQATLFGAKQESQEKRDYVFRRNTSKEALEEDGAAYFGFISPEEESSGPYHDLSLVIFPGTKYGDPWLVALGIGTLGYKNDYELAIIPGLRRSFSKIINPQNGFLKTSFLDIESKLPKEFTQKIPGIPKT